MPNAPSDPRQTFGPAAEKYVSSQVHSNPSALRRLVELARPRGGTMLDVATGSGHTAIAFAPHVDHVVASDMTQDMLRVCRKEANARGLGNISLTLAKAESLPFRIESFDGVTCRMGAHHFQNVSDFLNSVSRILKMGAWFLLVDTTGPEDTSDAMELDEIERLRDPSHVHDFSPLEWRKRLENAGFRIEQMEGTRKTLEVVDWMDRIAVPLDAREDIVARITLSKGALREYFAPREANGSMLFDLHEHAFLCRKSTTA